MYLERINNVFGGKLSIKRIQYFRDTQFLNLILSFVTRLWLCRYSQTYMSIKCLFIPRIFMNSFIHASLFACNLKALCLILVYRSSVIGVN